MTDDLANRLKSDENAFHSLLSLIPSKLYYAEEAQTQWKKRKQTPEERKEAKRAKLDPDQDNSAAAGRPVVVEKESVENENGLTKSQIKNRAKKLKKLQAQAEKDENRESQEKGESVPKSSSAAKSNGDSTIKVNGKKRKAESSKDSIKATNAKVNGISNDEKQSSTVETDSKLPNETSTSSVPAVQQLQPKIVTNGIHKEPTTISKPISKPLTNGIKPSASPTTNGTTRSPSVSIIPSPAPEVPSPSSITELRARLAARISQARLARKAVGTSAKGAPQTREAILQARAKRKAKVEEKIRAKREAQKQLVTPAEVKDESSDDEIIESGLKFGRVLIDDMEIDAGKGEVKVAKKKKKGPSDAKGKLEQLTAKEERLAKMDPEKAERAKENDRWHSALLSARGEKVKDDTSLLKKTIARKEREKKKSKREWDERIARVAKSQEDRQKKREENLAKRREEKGHKGKKVIKSKKPVVKKKRPGFEGGRVKIGRK